MATIDHHAAVRVLAAVRGHPFDRNAFAALFADMARIAVTFVDQPAAALLMRPETVSHFDVLLLYDMPGIDFASEPRAMPIGPEPALRDGMIGLLERGIGVVALHHALAGWPAWSGFAELLGGRFLYRPAIVGGEPRQDSGYRHKVRYTAEAVAPGHPILQGIPQRFELTDELYLAEMFENDVVPLLRADYRFVRENFYSATAAIEGRMFSNEDWEHPPGSDLIGWVKKARRSPLVYLQPGDDDTTYNDPIYRRIVENAIRWVASPEAHAWASGGSDDR